eukprot:s2722_g8.t1
MFLLGVAAHSSWADGPDGPGVSKGASWRPPGPAVNSRSSFHFVLCETAVQRQFEESSYAVLTEFLREDVAQRLARELEEVDKADGFQPDAEELPVPCYKSGAQDGWELVGPPHLRRFLRFSKTGNSMESPHGRLGCGLSDVAGELFASESFLRWLKACTGLDPKNDGRPQVRRFRPGLDYTVAARGAQDTDEADLDAILCFAMGGSEEEASAATEAWASEEVGGFECYLAADEEDETVEAQEVQIDLRICGYGTIVIQLDLLMPIDTLHRLQSS